MKSFSQPFPFQDAAAMGYPNGMNQQATPESMSPDILAAVRQQMCNMVDAANFVAGFNLPPNMSVQSMTPPNLGGSSSSNIQNPKVGSPAMNAMIKNGGESSNVMQMPRLGSPAMHNLPNELSMHGLHNLSQHEEDYRKKERNRIRKSSSVDEDYSQLDDHQKNLNNNRLSITKLTSPKIHTKSPSLEALEPAINLATCGQSLDMSFKSSRASSDGSINGDEGSPRPYHSFTNSSPIKLEPIASDCRD